MTQKPENSHESEDVGTSSHDDHILQHQEDAADIEDEDEDDDNVRRKKSTKLVMEQIAKMQQQ